MKKIIVINIIVVIFIAFLFLSKSSAISPEDMNLELLKMSKLDLNEAIKIATTEISGQPVEAHLESESGKQEPLFKITILKSGIFVVVSIDGKTGKVINKASLPQGVVPPFQTVHHIPARKGPEAVKPEEKGPEPIPLPVGKDSAPIKE